MILQNIFSVVFFLYLGLTAHVRSQTCESIYPSSPCSNNAACGCIPLAIADDIGICGLSAINCARLSSCDADYSCPSVNQMCVSHSRCGPTPICYPMSMTDPRLCPPMTTTTSSPFYTTQGNGTFETTTNGFDDNATVFYTTQGNETFETTTNGFNDNATEFYTTQGNETFETTTNGFNDNATEFYTTQGNGTFETTTNGFDDNATSSYPTDWIRSTYSGDLTMYSRFDPNTNKYYELYRIRVNISGQYQIRSISNMDTYGCIYYESPSTIISTNTSNPSNAMSCNDDNNGNQFQLNVYLYADNEYTLLFTTFNSNVTGLYTVEVYGADINEFYPIYHGFEITTAFSMNSTESENATTSQSAIVSIYSSVLTENSPKMLGFQRHYEAIEISVNISGFYTIRSEETLDGMGYLYHYYFNPSNERENLLVYDDQSGGNNQFSMSVYLEAGSPYVLVFTTYGANIVGSFSIIVSGAGRVELTHSSSIESTGTAAPFEFTTNSMNETDSYTNNSSIIVSEYSSALTTDSSNFSRPSGPSGVIYYEAIQINVYITGVYTFTSEIDDNGVFEVTTADFSSYNLSSTSDFVRDSYAYLYSSSFSPLSPTENLIVFDDDSAGSGQFRLSATLQADRSYVLVFTTYASGVTGSFSIKASGPDYVKFYPLKDV